MPQFFLQNHYLRFILCSTSPIYNEHFAKFSGLSEYMNFKLLHAKFDSKTKIGRPLWTFRNHKFFQPMCWKDAYKNVRFIMWKIAFYLVSFTWLSATSITMFLTAAQMCRVFSFDCTITWVNIFFKSTQKMHWCQGY